jgi:hypothetical protein
MPEDVKPSKAMESAQRVEDLHARLSDLLAELDAAELHGPAAHVSQAIDVMRRDYPDLSANR